ncbi:hypothetical protein Mgra_00000563 [Meloidogyne graminicola]|uniref:Uncharacterized protein n=1 Tax=Meloidogyne graminicola TaxID=189291 RepID=A0A8T0A2P9_9BILA|nr:hypothetical protein Mgra_00000563 [Meloidogyne graminicola]
MAQVTYPHHSPKQQRITQLPGENGFHARDGSLLRKKREQWEKEKAEAGQNSWFPFGDKRNKKVVNINSDKCQKEGNVDEQFDTSHNFQLETVQNVFQQSPPHFTLTNKQQSNYNNQNSCLQEINDNSSPSTTNIYQPTLLPFFVDYSMTGHFHSQHQLIPTINSYNQHQSPQHQLFPLPNGLIPVQTSSFQNSMPITFSGPATTIIDPLFLPHFFFKLPSVLQTPPYSVSSPDSGTSSSKGVIIPSDEINPCISTEELLRKNTHNNNNVNSPNICWKEELDRQVEEKKLQN